MKTKSNLIQICLLAVLLLSVLPGRAMVRSDNGSEFIVT